MPSSSASRALHSTGAHRNAGQPLVPGTRRRQAPTRTEAAGMLPSYCGRKPPAMLDDGWVGETLNHADELETMESGDDFLIDMGDLEDSR